MKVIPRNSGVLLTWASFLQWEDLQVEAVEQSEVLLPKEYHAPLRRPYLVRQVALLSHGWNKKDGTDVLSLIQTVLNAPH